MVGTGEDGNVVYGASSYMALMSWMSESSTLQVCSVSNLPRGEEEATGEMEI
jgi:hypothetical protein